MVHTWRNTENSDFSGSQEVNEWHPSLYLQTLTSLAATSTMTGSNFYCLFLELGRTSGLTHARQVCTTVSASGQSHFWTEWLSPSAAVGLSPNSSAVVQDSEQVTELNGPVSSSITWEWKARWQCWWRWYHPLCMATVKTEWVNKHAEQLAGRDRRVKETQLQTKAKAEIRASSGWWV